MENMHTDNHSRTTLNDASKRPLLWVAAIAVILLILAAMGAFKSWVPNSTSQSSSSPQSFSNQQSNDRTAPNRSVDSPLNPGTDPAAPRSTSPSQ